MNNPTRFKKGAIPWNKGLRGITFGKKKNGKIKKCLTCHKDIYVTPLIIINMKNKINWLIVHHTGGTELDPLADTSNHTFEIVNAWHRNDPNVWLGFNSKLGYSIGYHYFIDKTGKVTQGRLDGEQAAHTKGYNNNPTDSEENSAIGICLAGNFDVTFPTKGQIDSLKKLLNEKRKEYLIPRGKIVPHNHFSKKTCYGSNLNHDWASNLTIEAVKIPDPIIHTCVVPVVQEVKKPFSWYDLYSKFLAWATRGW